MFTGPAEAVFPNGIGGLSDYPDANVSFLQQSGGVSLWLTAETCGYHLVGHDLSSLAPAVTSVSDGRAVPALWPSGSGFDATYAGPGSVVQLPNNDLVMVYHAENTDAATRITHAAIGLARRSSDGETWTSRGPIIALDGQLSCPSTSNSNIWGDGEPSALLTPDHQSLRVYFVEWPANCQSAMVYVAQAAIDASGALSGPWQRLYDGEFTQPGIDGLSSPVIQPQSLQSSNTDFVAVPNVTYNTALKRYLAFVIAADGLYDVQSCDGLYWHTGHHVLDFDGIRWTFYYTSLLSPDQPDQWHTSGTGYLYFTYRTDPGTPTNHYLYRVPVDLRHIAPLQAAVGLGVAPGAHGQLNVSVRAATSGVTLDGLDFGPPTNGIITLANLVRSLGAVHVSLPPGTTQTSFTVQRLVDGLATTAPLTVDTNCGPWPTFVGGGATAF